MMYHDVGELHINQLPSIDYIYIPVETRYYYTKAFDCSQPRCTLGLVGSNNTHKRYFVVIEFD